MIPSILPILAFIGMASVQPGPALTDLYGDPLPDGAVVRMGSVRLRHRGLSDYLPLPDGKTVLTTGSDRVLRFWDIGTGRQVRAVRLQGTAGPGKGMTLSPDGKMLVAEDGQKLVFWEVDSGKELRTLPAPKVQRGYVSFSPDGKTLAMGRGDWRVSLWDLATGKEREIKLAFEPRPFVQFHMDSTFHGGFSPDGKWFVAGAAIDEPLGIFDAATGREVRRIKCRAYTSTVSPDNRRVAVSCAQDDKRESRTVIRLFDLATGKELAQFPFDTKDPSYGLAFSPDGKLLAAGRSDHSCLLDLTTGRVLFTLPDRPHALAFTPDGKTLVAAVGYRLRCWDVATGKEHDDRPGEFGGNPVLAVSPDGRLLAAGDWIDRVVILWDATDGRLLRRLPLKGEGRYVRTLAFSADGRTLVACQGMGFVQLWDAATGKEQGGFQLRDPNAANRQGFFFELRLSPDRKYVSALDRLFLDAGLATRLARWDAVTGKPLGEALFPGELRHVAWSVDGMAAILPLKDGLTLVDVSTGRVRLRYPGTAGISLITASPDGRLVAGQKLAKADAKRGPATVIAWEAATGKEVAALATGGVEHLALARNNRSLVTADASFLHVWDLATGKERRRWPLPDAVVDGWGKTAVLKLILAPNGRRAFTAMADGTCLAWDLTAAQRPAEPLVKGAGAKELAAWWADLASADAGRAYAAVWRLAEAPQAATVAFLRDHLRPVADADLQEARQLIADLHSDTFSIRDKANSQLEKLGDAATAAIRQAQAKDLPIEVRRRLEKLLAQPHALVDSPETMRRLRAIEVLEQIASPEARRLLAELAAGVPPAAQTQAAIAALVRLAHRPAER